MNNSYIKMYKFKPVCSFINDLYNNDANVIDTEHELWVNIKNVREQSNLIFIGVYDGTHIKPFQLIIDIEKNPEVEDFRGKLHTGAYIKVKGKIVKSPAKGQTIEMLVTSLNLEGSIRDTNSYLPLVKGVNLDILRGKNSYLRPKFQTYQAVYTIVDKVDQFVNDFMRNINFKKIDPNILSLSECEGAGEMFVVTNMLKDDIKEVPVLPNGKIDYSKDFFNKKVGLTVSSQLQLEALCPMGKGVYTMNKSFRAEKSKTSRHLCEFTHFEFETRLINTVEDLMNFEEDLITNIIKRTLVECKDELESLNSFVSKGIVNRLEGFVKEDFARTSYTNAVDIITRDVENIKKIYELNDSDIPKWGDDLGGKCERYLAEHIFKKPVFVYNYPLELKSFYMKQNKPDENSRLTVGAVDLLIPNLGELIGSSLRENDYDKLVNEMDRRQMDKSSLQWYIDLRKNGSMSTAGAGVGMNRLWQMLCYMDSNIRDVTPFAVSFEECYF